MSTYLELCKETAQECGIGNADGSEPASVTNQEGELKRIVDWVRIAYDDIQRFYSNWRWLRGEFSLSTTAGTASYAFGDCTDIDTGSPISRFRDWWLMDRNNPPTIYKTADGEGTERWLVAISWRNYRTLYKIGTHVNSAPVHIAVDPQENIVLGPTPDDDYTIKGEYQKSLQTLSADGDEPEMPADFHRLIVCKAMEKYAGYESASEVMDRAIMEGRPIRRHLELNQLPRFKTGRTLVR